MVGALDICPKCMAQEFVPLPAGSFWSGSDRYYPEESPRHVRAVSAFAIAKSPVTNDQFSKFVADTGYVTTAERNQSALVFAPPRGAFGKYSLADLWQPVETAYWRMPDGENEVGRDCGSHPVVQVSHSDAIAFAKWSSARLPSEAEWEYAAFLGKHSADGPDEIGNKGAPRSANIWLGAFPIEREDGLSPWGTSDVGTYPANTISLFDMIGNVWEWCSDPYTSSHRDPCCGPGSNGHDVRVIKGGSHLCSPSYCQRYRPSARQSQSVDGSTNHIGFRLALDVEGRKTC